MQFEVKIPYWAENETDQDWILFLAFMYKISKTYGMKSLYKIYNSDLRVILGQMHDYPHKTISEQNWAGNVEIAKFDKDAWGYRLLRVRNRNTDEDSVVVKTLDDTRCVMVWIYLMGCFNNNLVEEDSRKQKIGLQRDWRNILAGLCKTTLE